jgi:UDP-N-acetylglucosamine--N-acetylmuramyl-(pentapeptide) pyrophosphoryl-undecaprenol N-acetylglucosamine transferase
MKVLIAGGGTGGHLMPALAIAEALAAMDSTVEPVLVGAQRGVEASLLPQREYRHYLLPLEPIYRRQWWKNLRWPVIAWRVLRECSAVLQAEQPRLALGTGGYASGPMLFQAGRSGVPIAVQEQNAVPGLATRWLARRASQIHLGFPEAAEYLNPGRHTAVHSFGNPVMPPPDPRPTKDDARRALALVPDLPVVLVMGGSQGARIVNQVVGQLVESGHLKDVALLWSTGTLTWDRYRRYDAPPNRQVRAFWDPIAHAYAAADVVIARAGAMTTAELCAWGLPSILVPLPSAAADHQTRNAGALAAAGAAIHLPEAELSSERLLDVLGDLLKSDNRMAQMARSARARGHPKAARKIASQLLALVS